MAEQLSSAVNKPVVPIRSFMAVIIWDIEIIHLPGALVVGHVSPLDEIMHIPIFIKTARNKHDQKGDVRVSQGSVLLLAMNFLCV